jgi:hypothetical protein
MAPDAAGRQALRSKTRSCRIDIQCMLSKLVLIARWLVLTRLLAALLYFLFRKSISK